MIELAEWLPLGDLLQRQDQLIRRDQAYSSGLTRPVIDGHLRHGRWTRVLPSVYLTEPMVIDEGRECLQRRRIRATWMWAGDDAVIAGAAAAFWAGYLPVIRGPIDVIVPPSRRMTAQSEVSVVRATLEPCDTIMERGILLTHPHRSALDLAAAGCSDLLYRMARGNSLRAAALDAVLARGARRRGWSTARLAVRESRTNPHSEAERLTHRALRAGGVWGWRANVELVICGQAVRPDLVFDDVKLAVEIDGYSYHAGRDIFERDRARQNLLTAAGWTVLRFTWRQVRDDPSGMVAQIEATRSMLRARPPVD